MNLQKHLITVCCAIGLTAALTSCSKSDSKEDVKTSIYPQTFTATNIAVKNDSKLYIAQAEVNNPAAKNRFLEYGATNPANDVFAFEQKGDTYISGLASIIFISADTARLSTSTEKYVVTRNNNQLVFTSILSQLTPIITPFPELLKYPELQTTSETSGVRKKVIVGVIGNNELKISGVAYKIAQYVNQFGVNRYNYRWGAFYNEFNADVVKSLNVKDTLAVKEYTYTFKVK